MKTKLKTSWKEVTLGEVAEFINGRAFKPEEWENKGKIIIRIQDLTNSINSPNFTTKIFEKKYLVKKGDVLISWSATLDAFIWNKEDGWLNQHIFKVKEKKEIIDKKFLFYLIKNRIEDFKKQTHGSTMKHITKDKFTSIKFFLPSISAQKKIILTLEKIEQLKEARKEADELTREYLKSVFFKMVKTRNIKQSKIGDVILSVENVNPTKTMVDNFFEYVGISSINNKIGKIVDSKKILGQEAPSRAKQKIKYFDLIISTVRPNLNAVALVPKELDNQICSTGFCVLRADTKKILPEYLYMISRSDHFINSMIKLAKGASYPAVSNKDIFNHEISIPSLFLQQEFATIFKNVSSIKEQQKNTKRHIDNLFNQFLQTAFKGEITC